MPDMREGLPSRSFQSTGNLSDPRRASSVVTLHKARSQSYGSLQEEYSPTTPPTPRSLRRTPSLVSEALVSQDAFVKSYSVLTDDEEDSSVDYYSSDEELGVHESNNCAAATSDAMLLTDLAVGGLTFLMSTVRYFESCVLASLHLPSYFSYHSSTFRFALVGGICEHRR